MKPQFVFLIFFVSLSLSLSAASHKTPSGTLSITIVGIDDLEGDVLIAIGDKANPADMKCAIIRADEYELHASFADVPLGKVTVNAFHDMNGNKQLDFGDFGKPLEPCLSKNITFKGEKTPFTIELIKY